MDFTLLGAALLLMLTGLWLLYSLRTAPREETEHQPVGGARTGLEQSWQAEPMGFFMRQLFAARRDREGRGQWRLWM